ncbi:MAG: DUF1822 family protein [Cyanothece sp. SIO1E1]|nr:DUF1822 family protein [Cyanothece sp. SIO1E1]
MNQITQPLTFPVPLTSEAHTIAQDYSNGQSNPQRAKQIYLNTLAIYAVDFYLRCLGFEPDWPASDSRNPLMLKLTDVADLEIKQLGKLECRALLPTAQMYEVPSDAWNDRIGYVAVQLDQSLKQATLVGFTPDIAQHQGMLPICGLRSLAEFLQHLNHLKQPEPLRPINLSQWFQNTFDAGWQMLETLYKPTHPKPALGFRGAKRVSGARCVTGVKPIDLGSQFADYPMDLTITLTQKSEHRTRLETKIVPRLGEHLPEGLKLTVIDHSGQTFLEISDRTASIAFSPRR